MIKGPALHFVREILTPPAVAADDQAVRLRLVVPALLAGGVLAFAGPAPAAPVPARLWTETKADAVLLLKLRLPCASVRSAGGCRVASAARPSTNEAYVRKGFPIRTARCKGGGAPDRTGRRFSVFQCQHHGLRRRESDGPRRRLRAPAHYGHRFDNLPLASDLTRARMRDGRQYERESVGGSPGVPPVRSTGSAIDVDGRRAPADEHSRLTAAEATHPAAGRRDAEPDHEAADPPGIRGSTHVPSPCRRGAPIDTRRDFAVTVRPLEIGDALPHEVIPRKTAALERRRHAGHGSPGGHPWTRPAPTLQPPSEAAAMFRLC